MPAVIRPVTASMSQPKSGESMDQVIGGVSVAFVSHALVKERPSAGNVSLHTSKKIDAVFEMTVTLQS